MRLKNRFEGFTLIEVLIGLTIFSMLIIVAGGWLTKIASNWKVQRDYLMMSQEADAVMEVLAQDIRRSMSISGTSNTLLLQVEDTKGVYYQKSGYVLTRWRSDVWPVTATSLVAPENLTRHIVYDDIFNLTALPKVYVNITVRPKPGSNTTITGNKDYTIHSMIQRRR